MSQNHKLKIARQGREAQILNEVCEAGWEPLRSRKQPWTGACCGLGCWPGPASCHCTDFLIHEDFLLIIHVTLAAWLHQAKPQLLRTISICQAFYPPLHPLLLGHLGPVSRFLGGNHLVLLSVFLHLATGELDQPSLPGSGGWGRGRGQVTYQDKGRQVSVMG